MWWGGILFGRIFFRLPPAKLLGACTAQGNTKLFGGLPPGLIRGVGRYGISRNALQICGSCSWAEGSYCKKNTQEHLPLNLNLVVTAPNAKTPRCSRFVIKNGEPLFEKRCITGGKKKDLRTMRRKNKHTNTKKSYLHMKP